VVPDVPVLRVVPFADIWVPYTTEKSDSFRAELVGNYIGILLLRDPAKLALTRDEFWSRLRTITPPDRMFKTVEATPETLFDTLGRMFVGSGSGLGTGYGAKLAAVLAIATTVFMLLPAHIGHRWERIAARIATNAENACNSPRRACVLTVPSGIPVASEISIADVIGHDEQDVR